MTTESSRVLRPEHGGIATTSVAACTSANTLSRSMEEAADVAARGRAGNHSLHRVASHGERPMPDRQPAAAQVRMRIGSADDVEGVMAMHARCSPETVERRYHVPHPRISPRLARALLVPAHGVSVVGTVEDQIVAVGVLAADSDLLELGLMVEDRWQHQGVGTLLLRRLANEARCQGADQVVCVIRPDNTAVLTMIRRAGFRPLVTEVDGLLHCSIPVGTRSEDRRRRGRASMGTVTAPLVTLLHERAELRAVYPAADLLDQAVRGGA